ncbi:MAG: patatin-like phospholipase family protein [Noviherbaspirillum sp.]|jgi:NTE family protein|nr:patatin-like phospholipase family protein [Noviherbaspirillum sp.]
MDFFDRIGDYRPRVVLVLQGGGALGAYQAGVYQAMHEHSLTPDWVVGTSIGAINASIIAGNAHSQCIGRLKEFWNTVAKDDLFDMRHVPDELRRLNIRLTTMDSVLNGVRGFYSPRPLDPFPLNLPVAPERASFYDTSELAKTLGRLVDLHYLNAPGGMRMTVCAIQVNCGRLETFDTRRHTVEIEHVMASGALPPGFPPIRVGKELFWDGGLYSNTPLEVVLNDEPRAETLCFMVDLWSPDGPEPSTLEQVQTRQKDVLYASRSHQHIETYLRMHRLRGLVRALRDKVPPGILSPEELSEIEELGAETTMHIIQLEYAGRDWQMASKDINFSKGSIEWRWERGYQDALRAIKRAPWRKNVPRGAGVVVHELVPGVTECGPE